MVAQQHDRELARRRGAILGWCRRHGRPGPGLGEPLLGRGVVTGEDGQPAEGQAAQAGRRELRDLAGIGAGPGHVAKVKEQRDRGQQPFLVTGAVATGLYGGEQVLDRLGRFSRGQVGLRLGAQVCGKGTIGCVTRRGPVRQRGRAADQPGRDQVQGGPAAGADVAVDGGADQ